LLRKGCVGQQGVSTKEKCITPHDHERYALFDATLKTQDKSIADLAWLVGGEFGKSNLGTNDDAIATENVEIADTVCGGTAHVLTIDVQAKGTIGTTFEPCLADAHATIATIVNGQGLRAGRYCGQKGVEDNGVRAELQRGSAVGSERIVVVARREPTAHSGD